MRKTSLYQLFGLGILLVFSISLGVVGMNATANADTCKHRGDLDTPFCDEDGDLLADTPKNPDQWLDPDTLVFSYTAVEDPSVYENVFSELMDHIALKTGVPAACTFPASPPVQRSRVSISADFIPWP